jgi:hypothetical protein
LTSSYLRSYNAADEFLDIKIVGGEEVSVFPTDVDTRRQLALLRAAHLADAGHHGESRGGARRRLGFWLVEVGLRLACERPVLSQV